MNKKETSSRDHMERPEAAHRADVMNRPSAQRAKPADDLSTSMPPSTRPVQDDTVKVIILAGNGRTSLPDMNLPRRRTRSRVDFRPVGIGAALPSPMPMARSRASRNLSADQRAG